MNEKLIISLLAACIVTCAMAADIQPASRPATTTSTAPGGWTVAYSIAPNQPGKIGPEWLLAKGATAEIAAGALVLKPTEDTGASCEVMLKAPAVPGSVKVEFDAVLDSVSPSDISVILNANEKGLSTGYLLQFGGKGNTYTGLTRAGEAVDSTVSDMAIKGGQKYRVVAANDAGRVSLSVDGKEVFSYKDPDPLEGDENGMVGFYTFASTLKITGLTIFRKPGELELRATTQNVDEKAVAALIGQLGDTGFKVREAATAKLIEMGKAIHPILKAKLQEKDLDLEISSRIQLVLSKGRKTK